MLRRLDGDRLGLEGGSVLYVIDQERFQYPRLDVIVSLLFILSSSSYQTYHRTSLYLRVSRFHSSARPRYVKFFRDLTRATSHCCEGTLTLTLMRLLSCLFVCDRVSVVAYLVFRFGPCSLTSIL